MVGAVALLTACKDDKSPNYQYMPNMYESVAYETYSESAAFNSPNAKSENGKEGQLPPAGTIKRGYVPYELPNTPEGYEASKAIANPFPAEKNGYEKSIRVIQYLLCYLPRNCWRWKR